MIFKEIFQKLENSASPVAQVIENMGSGKVIAIGFRKGMALKEHKTAVPAHLLVVKGNVEYLENGQGEMLSLFDKKDIPINVLHSVYATEDSLCLLFK